MDTDHRSEITIGDKRYIIAISTSANRTVVYEGQTERFSLKGTWTDEQVRELVQIEEAAYKKGLEEEKVRSMLF